MRCQQILRFYLGMEQHIYVDMDITLPYKLWAKYQGKTGDIP